jgi:hypothetical protein
MGGGGHGRSLPVGWYGMEKRRLVSDA